MSGLTNEVGTHFAVRAVNSVGQKSAWTTPELVYPGTQAVPVSVLVVTDTTNSRYVSFGSLPKEQSNPALGFAMARVAPLVYRYHATAVAGGFRINGFDQTDTSGQFTEYLDARERVYKRPVSITVNGTRLVPVAYRTRGGGDYYGTLSSSGAVTPVTTAPF